MSLKKFKVDFGGRELTLESGRLAQQANGSILVTYGGTMVLATCVMGKEAIGVDYMPLNVNYEERLYAVGKIKGSRFIKREGRATDEAILTGRMIDRCLRPLFDSRIRNDIQIVLTVLSFDKENDPDIPSLVASSAALLTSNIPWDGPVSGIRVGRVNGQLILNPTYKQREEGDMDLVVSGKDNKINMIEAGAKEVSEGDLLSAIEFAQSHIHQINNFQEEIRKSIGIEKVNLEFREINQDLINKVKDFLEGKLEKAIYGAHKAVHGGSLYELRKDLMDYIKSTAKEEELMGSQRYAGEIFESEIDHIVHKNVLEKDMRPDGRKLDEVRQITCDVGILKQTHGSGLFQRGATQALSVVTLGAPSDEQIIDDMEIDTKKRFLHHYNFPPFSVGEAGPMRGPGRREIGHGALAERALLPILPSQIDFPYTIRVVSEILASNGSSSMASVSGSSLALMDTGVPIKENVTGIAMGLIMDSDERYKILTDIQGPEDHHGDMDCKVAGTKNGITACQMDVKVHGITLEIIKETLQNAKRARLEILQTMDAAISHPRAELSPLAPRILTLQVNPEKIGTVIGPQGKTINGIIDKTGAKIDIDDSGLIYITAASKESGEQALALVKDLVREIKTGEIFQGKVVKIMDFGAFIELLPGQDGLLHISELSDKHIKNVEEIVKLNQIVTVKVKSIDTQGRVNLTLKESK